MGAFYFIFPSLNTFVLENKIYHKIQCRTLVDSPQRNPRENPCCESLGKLRVDSGTPQGVDQYYHSLFKKPLLECSERFKFMKILEGLPVSFKEISDICNSPRTFCRESPVTSHFSGDSSMDFVGKSR